MKKRLIAVMALLMCMATHIWACWTPAEYEGGTSFRIVQPFPDFNSAYTNSTLGETVNFWFGYFKKSIKQDVIRDFFKEAPYDALDNENFASNPFAVAVKKDANASKYLRACLMLQGDTEERWEYRPEGDCLGEAASMLKQMNSMPEVFASRVALLKMRVYTAQKDYEKVEKVWNSEGKSCSDKALQNRMRGYYAGVLYKQGKLTEAMSIYAELGDQVSMRWCVSKFIGYKGIKQLSEMQTADANVALQYALQDYVNYYWHKGGDSFYYDEEDLERVVGDVQKDANRMKQFCAEMAEKSSDKMIWLSALSWMELADGNNAEALSHAQQACKQKGTVLQKENAERILMLANLRNAPIVMNEKVLKALANDFQTLCTRSEEEIASKDAKVSPDDLTYRYDNVAFCPNYCFLMDTYKPALDEYFKKNHLVHGQVIADNMCDQILSKSYEGAASKWQQNWFEALDSSFGLEDVASFCEAIKKKKFADAFAQQLGKKFDCDTQVLNDLVGTKCMREGKYGQALNYLNQLTPNYITSTNYRAYLATRNFGYKVMFQRSQYKEVDEEMIVPTATNFKAEFCKDMVDRINALSSLTGDEKAKAEIEMAHRMFQASNMGDLWALSEFGWSSANTTPNKLCAQARVQLNNALKDCQSEAVRFDVYYGLASVPTGEPFWSLDYDWDEQVSVYKFTRFHPSRAAFDYLVSHRNVRDIVSTCDVLRNYAKQN